MTEVCSWCWKAGADEVCSGCGQAAYCGEECQANGWVHGGHKQCCARGRMVGGIDLSGTDGTAIDPIVFVAKIVQHDLAKEFHVKRIMIDVTAAKIRELITNISKLLKTIYPIHFWSMATDYKEKTPGTFKLMYNAFNDGAKMLFASGSTRQFMVDMYADRIRIETVVSTLVNLSKPLAYTRVERRYQDPSPDDISGNIIEAVHNLQVAVTDYYTYVENVRSPIYVDQTAFWVNVPETTTPETRINYGAPGVAILSEKAHYNVTDAVVELVHFVCDMRAQINPSTCSLSIARYVLPPDHKRDIASGHEDCRKIIGYAVPAQRSIIFPVRFALSLCESVSNAQEIDVLPKKKEDKATNMTSVPNKVTRKIERPGRDEYSYSQYRMSPAISNALNASAATAAPHAFPLLIAFGVAFSNVCRIGTLAVLNGDSSVITNGHTSGSGERWGAIPGIGEAKLFGMNRTYAVAIFASGKVEPPSVPTVVGLSIGGALRYVSSLVDIYGKRSSAKIAPLVVGTADPARQQAALKHGNVALAADPKVSLGGLAFGASSVLFVGYLANDDDASRAVRIPVTRANTQKVLDKYVPIVPYLPDARLSIYVPHDQSSDPPLLPVRPALRQIRDDAPPAAPAIKPRHEDMLAE